MNQPFRKSGFIGLGVILVSLILMAINPKEVPKMPDGFTTPILAFEFVQSKQEVWDLFGKDTAVRADLTRAFDLGSWVDFVYILLYGGFLFTFAVTCVRQTGNKLYWGTAVFAMIIMFGDVMENVQLLDITAAVETGTFQQQLTLLPIFTWIKWGGLSISFLLLTPYFFTQNLFARLIGIVAIITFGLGGIAFLNRSQFNEYYALSIALMFVLMIIYSFTTTTR
jgi:hypothetical protein